MEAFEPRPDIFMHVCKNCKHGKKVTGAANSALGYICELKKGTQRLFGTHKCDELMPLDKDQTNMFAQIDIVEEE